jgi:uncharacterized protein YjbI with pentapeptide repeats
VADEVLLDLLRQPSAQAWNAWRQAHPQDTVDLVGANLVSAELEGALLGGADLCGANLLGAKLRGANLGYARLAKANLRDADLSDADLSFADFGEAVLCGANLSHAKAPDSTFDKAQLAGVRAIGIDMSEARMREADLSDCCFASAKLVGVNLTGARLVRADLSGASLCRANLTDSDLSYVNLTAADLTKAILVKTNLERSLLNHCRVYGMSAWGVRSDGAEQSGLIITPEEEPTVMADQLEVAQFVYLLLTREKLREVIDTITSKAILCLGRFTPERKEILHTIAAEIRKRDFIPIIFDFDQPMARSFTETIKILAGLSMCIIADITNPRSTPLELQAVVPDFAIPVVPIIQEGEQPFSMSGDLRLYPWVLDTVTYSSSATLVLIFEAAILDPAWKKHEELQAMKASGPRVRSWREFTKKGEPTSSPYGGRPEEEGRSDEGQRTSGAEPAGSGSTNRYTAIPASS